ncbi:MAG: ATP-dependent DNA ligase [Actinophytocola sp.]|nr:ATP-dependent DNA ligase [Actinophytocola sp.]
MAKSGSTEHDLSEGTFEVEGKQLALSNLDKVLYPSTGTTKRDVLTYYRDAAPALLPHLRGRPLTMKRYPDGVEGAHFYEKRCPPWRPDWITTAAVWSDRKQRDIDYCVIDDLPTLLWAANLADLELHTMLARSDDLDVPTMMVFDLDPGQGMDLGDCAVVASQLGDALAELGLTTLVKASGSNGLHLHVPLNTDVTYERTKPFAKAIARRMEQDNGDRVVSRMTRSARKGRVLIDWSQNTTHKSTVVPFSLRARQRPTVAVPVTSQEVHAVADGHRQPEHLLWDAWTVLARLDERAELAQPLLTLQQHLPESTEP